VFWGLPQRGLAAPSPVGGAQSFSTWQHGRDLTKYADAK
jgi:hypothetical protein